MNGNVFSKKLKFADIKCLDKWENKLLPRRTSQKLLSSSFIFLPEMKLKTAFRLALLKIHFKIA